MEIYKNKENDTLFFEGTVSEVCEAVIAATQRGEMPCGYDIADWYYVETEFRGNNLRRAIFIREGQQK